MEIVLKAGYMLMFSTCDGVEKLSVYSSRFGLGEYLGELPRPSGLSCSNNTARQFVQAEAAKYDLRASPEVTGVGGVFHIHSNDKDMPASCRMGASVAELLDELTVGQFR